MPSEKVLQVKQNYVAELAEKLKKSACGVLVDYSGITVADDTLPFVFVKSLDALNILHDDIDADDTVLRKELREAGVDYFVVKNTLLKRAAEMAGVEGIEDVLEGTTALALAEEDIVTAPKILYKQEEASNGSFSIKKGFVDGKGISKDEVVAYAKLPTKETLLAQLVFMLQSPIQKLAIAVSEIEKKQSESAE